MQDLTTVGQHFLSDAATRRGFSEDAAGAALLALPNNSGTAQFNHPGLAGMGQWPTGVVMVGDMFNDSPESRVGALCHDLAEALNHGGVFHETAATPEPGTSANRRPAELGSPSSPGAQNDRRCAVSPAARRVAVQPGGKVTVYDTGEPAIHGVSQAQGGSQTLVFSSQTGQVSTAVLRPAKA